MMHFHNILIYITIALLTVGCTSTKVPKDAKVEFKTRISSGGLKHFQLRLNYDPEQREQIRPRRQERPTSANQARTEFNKKQELLRALAHKEIAINKFCITGFWEIENAADARNPYIRGECNETATEKDKITFSKSDLTW